MELRKNTKTTEFRGTLIFLAALLISQLVESSASGWDFSMCVVASSYILGRGLLKKSRLALIGQGIKTSEFWIYAIAVTAIFLRVFFRRTDFGSAIVSAAFIQAAYNLSRGHAKSFIPTGKSAVLQI